MPPPASRVRTARRALTLALPSLLLLLSAAPASPQAWSRAWGLRSDDSARAVVALPGGGVVSAGVSWQPDTGRRGILVLSLDRNGEIAWERAYRLAQTHWGAEELEIASLRAIPGTDDLVIAGSTETGIPGSGGVDAWIAVLGGDGSVRWSRAYGGGLEDRAWDVQPVPGGGFLVAGETRSYGAGGADGWLFRLDASGKVLWSKSCGGPFEDRLRRVVPRDGGGFWAGGSTDSWGIGEGDLWLLHLDTEGSPVRARTLGGPRAESLHDLWPASDGGLLVAASTASFGNAILDPVWGQQIGDGWVLRLDAGLGILWENCYGANRVRIDEDLLAVREMPDGKILLAGRVNDLDLDPDFGAFGRDGWLLLLDRGGEVAASEILPTEMIYDELLAVDVAAGAPFFAAAGTTSAAGFSSVDFWVLRGDPAAGDVRGWRSLASGTYTIRPTAAHVLDAPGGPAQTAAVQTADLRLQDAGIPADGRVYASGCGGDGAPRDGACGPESPAIRPGETLARNFCDDREDWLRFAACAGTGYVLETAEVSPGLGTALEIYGGDCATLLAGGDAGTGEGASRVSWTATASGTVHVRVRPRDGGMGEGRAYSVRLEAVGGAAPCFQWANAYGEEAVAESARRIVETADGGFVLLGWSRPSGPVLHTDGWAAKIAPSGQALWWRALGGEAGDSIEAAVPARDGGVVAAGSTRSAGGGQTDAWLLKLGSSGDVAWSRTWGGPGRDAISALAGTSDGGFVVAGLNSSESRNLGVWIARLDGEGRSDCASCWQKRYGFGEVPAAVTQSRDGGFLAGGWTARHDLWLMKLDGAGEPVWQRTAGGLGFDEGRGLALLPDGGAILAGWARTGAGLEHDLRVVRVDAMGRNAWQRVYGGEGYDDAFAIAATSDGGFILAGTRDEAGAAGPRYRAWLLKHDAAGNVEWQKTYGPATAGLLGGVIQTADGGYAAAGNAWLPGRGIEDAWVIRTGARGEIAPTCALVEESADPGRVPANPVLFLPGPPASVTAETAAAFEVSARATGGEIGEVCTSSPAGLGVWNTGSPEGLAAYMTGTGSPAMAEQARYVARWREGICPQRRQACHALHDDRALNAAQRDVIRTALEHLCNYRCPRFRP